MAYRIVQQTRARMGFGALCVFLFSFDGFGQIPAATDKRAKLPLLSATGQPAGAVWLNQSSDGLVIAGKISGTELDWAKAPAALDNHDYLQIWFRTSSSVPMPQIAWGNQFGFVTCDSEAYRSEAGTNASAAAKCAEWTKQQIRYRLLLKSTFERCWRLAPGVVQETLATPALEHTLTLAENADLKKTFTGLMPHALPRLETGVGGDASSFRVHIPWMAFPPIDSLRLQSVFIAVDLVERRRLKLMTASRSAPETQPKLATLSLPEAHEWQITKCQYPLTQGNIQGWFFPVANGPVMDVFRLENETRGYAYSPEGLSPIPIWAHYFERSLTADQTVCGPQLRFVVPGKRFEIDDEIAASPLRDHVVTGRGGAHLLKAGPVIGTLSPFGTGACGSCPAATLKMFYLDPEQGMDKAFEETIVKNGTSVTDGDIQVSPDWRTITVYQANPDGAWSFERFCLSGVTYEQCGSGASGPPPEPRQVTF